MGGFGCKNLGDIDTYWMWSTEAVTLHEIFHFPGLFEDVPDYAARMPIAVELEGTIPAAGPIDHSVSDWFGKDPPGGYGAYNAKRLNEVQPIDKDQDMLQWEAIYNADNDVWYAVSSFYSKECGRDFKKCLDKDNTWPKRKFPPWPFNIDPPKP